MTSQRANPSPPERALARGERTLVRGAGEGGSPRSGETGEGAFHLNAEYQQTPHPAQPSAGPPSPAGGEGMRVVRASQNKKAAISELKIKRARSLRQSMTDAERKLWFALKGRRFQEHKFRRQAPVGPYIADFASFESRLVVEVDGGQHVDSTSDQERDAYMRENNFRGARYWNNDVLKNLDGVLEDLWRRLTTGDA